VEKEQPFIATEAPSMIRKYLQNEASKSLSYTAQYKDTRNSKN
jgi:hypothetical protein